jgi:hypothetical protein
MSPSNKNGICPACGKKKKNVDMHMKIEHPDYKAETTSETVDSTKKVKRLWNVTWWKLIVGAACLVLGIFGLVLYAGSMNIFAGFLSIVGLVPGAFLTFTGFRSKKESGYQFEGTKKYTGKENAIVIRARWDDSLKRAVPEGIFFEEIKPEKIPVGAQPHLLRNTGKHYYELYNPIDENGVEGELKPVIMPDKKLVTPEAFVVPSNMQAYKEYMQYNPPTAFQKIASGVLLIALVVIGILMTMTTDKSDTKQQVTRPAAMEINYDNVR